MPYQYLRSSFLIIFAISVCSLSAQDISANYFQGDTLLAISQSGSAPSVTTFTIDETCEQLKIEITDPVNDPQGTSKPYSVRVRNADGNQITDLTDRLTVTMRARSAGEVPVEFLFRSGDGTSDFRTSRRGIVIPAGLDAWTEMSVTFDASDFGPSFDPADIRDLWFYLDRSNDNFVGNEFYIDHIVTGGAPDPEQNSPCMLGGNAAQSYVDYFQADSLTSFNTTNSAAQASTITLDTECESVIISVTDTMNAPLPPFNAYQINPTDENGDDITDITGNMNVTMRVRSLDAVNVSFLLRSGDGTSSSRSDRLDVDIPAGLDEWTEFTLTFTEAELGGFDPADLRDIWFYLDRGTENFNGNEFHIDHIAVGTLPDPAQNSPCPIDDSGNPGVFVDYFQADTLSSFTTTNAAGRRTNFAYDTDCEALVLSVIDPVNDPLPPFNAFQVNPTDESGDNITDITGNLNVTMRVRSAEAVNVSILLRSGGGGMEERTDRLAVDIPGGVDEWTQFTVEFTEADLAGFNPADLRDFWFYLDRGEANFSGNFFAIDHVAVGTQPDTEQNSPCSLVSVPTEFVVQFADGESVDVLAGTEIDRLTLNVNDCEEVSLQVTDPVGAPLGAFRPIVINPTDAAGAPITNVEGQTDVFIRVRSAEEFPISVLFRSGDGSPDFRTAAVSKMVEGDLTGWSNLVFSFTEEELGNFDPTDLIDLWVFLDRDNDNFPGNELYIDYIAIGSQPDSTGNSPCGLPDLVSGTNEAPWAGNLSLYPNPTGGMITVDIPRLAGSAQQIYSRLLDITGRAVRYPQNVAVGGRVELDLSGLPAGVYFLQLTDAIGNRALRRVVKQ